MITFENSALADYLQWEKEDKRIFEKINTLFTAISVNPFRGIGKPKPLKGNWAGYWSRRITKEHRLIYKVFPNHILITSCKDHY